MYIFHRSLKLNVPKLVIIDDKSQIIANRRKEALELGLSPDVAESVWRSMIKAFIALEEKVNKEH